jgi:hypothetical protein
MNPQNAQTVFESAVMNIYDIYYEKMRYNIWWFNYAIFPIFSDFSIKSYKFTQNLFKAPNGQSANKAHLVAFFISIQKIAALKIPPGEGTGVIGGSRTSVRVFANEIIKTSWN